MTMLQILSQSSAEIRWFQQHKCAHRSACLLFGDGTFFQELVCAAELWLYLPVQRLEGNIARAVLHHAWFFIVTKLSLIL